MPASRLISRLDAAFAARDWSAMQGLYHPDALVFTVTGGPKPFPADTVIAELERASSDAAYKVSAGPPQSLDDYAAIITGSVRWRTPSGAFEDASHTWLITVKDDLVYRQAIYSTAADAIAAYAELGLNLGVGPTPEAASLTALVD